MLDIALQPTLSTSPCRSGITRWLAAGGLAASAAAFAPDAASADSAFTPSTVFVQAGTAGNTHEQTAGLTWDWGKGWSIAGGRISGYWETSLSRWAYSREGGRSASVGKLEIAPVFRFRPSDGASPWFVDAAIGLTLMNRRYVSDRKTFSTRFNFGDHLAIGRNFGAQGQYEVALRVEHVSNGGIKEPNPGESLLKLRLSYGFR
jgi:lipid A 3-O-deacylase